MNLTIARRLQGMIVGAILALVIVGLSGIFAARNIEGALQRAQENTIPSMQTLARIQLLASRIDYASTQRALSNRYDTTTAKEKAIADAEAEMLKLFEQYNKSLASDEKDRQFLAADRKAFQAYIETLRDVFTRTGGASTHDDIMNMLQLEVEPLAEQLQQALEQHVAHNNQVMLAFERQTSTTSNRMLIAAGVIMLLGSLLVGGVGFMLITGITRALAAVRNAIIHIEDNLDFTGRVRIVQRDELGATAEALNRLITKMQDNLRTIANGANQVASAAQEMTSASDLVARASVQQSEAASDMAATVEEITVSINHVADRAGEANTLSANSGSLAREGEAVISQTVSDIRDIADTVHRAAEGIRQLETQGEKIAAVLAVIKEVADQTNLLALNAAIEAARAGEQGRGFAVVADEVRKLAERTASSTQEITRTIDAMRASARNAVAGMEETVSKVGVGVERAHDASDAIQKIGAGSREAVSMVAEITEAIREQGMATNNIATHVERIAQMAEESSAAAGQSANHAQALDALAREMRTIVASYRL